MNKFRKAAAMLLVFAMVLALSVTALAAPSPVAAFDITKIVTSVEAEGLDEGITIVVTGEFADEAEAKAVEELKDEPAKALAAVEEDTDSKLVFAADVYAIDKDGNEVVINSAVTLKMEVEGIEDGDEIVILQLLEGEWNKVEAASVEEGMVVVTLEKLSPIAVFVK